MQTDALKCGDALYGETVNVVPLPLFGIEVRGNAPSGVPMFLVIDGIAPCTALLAAPPGIVLGPAMNVLASPPLGRTALPIPSGSSPTFIPVPADPAFLDVPFAAQFARLADGKLSFGAAFDVVLAGIPLPRNSTVPARPITERNLYGEDHVAWAPFDDGTPRHTLLVPFAPGATHSSGTVTLANGVQIVLADVSVPKLAPALLARVEALAVLVQRRWGHRGYRLRVTSAKRPTSFGGGSISYHKYGRAIDCSLANADGGKLTLPGSSQAANLDRLARLAVEAGFDWVWHEPNSNVAEDHVHASVHTVGPSVVIDNVSPGFEVPNSTLRRWTVTVTVTDPDGVWQVFGEVRPTGQPLPWGQFQPVAKVSVDTTAPTSPAQFTFDVEAQASVVVNNQATLHVWARDTFGSLAIDLAQAAPRVPVAVTQTVSVVATIPNMVPIARGTFSMGSNATSNSPYFNQPESQPVHLVTITRPFWIGKYEVTQAEYQAVMGSNPSFFAGAQRPVETVSWNDAVAYCAALTATERAAGHVPTGYQYRLPTEAEWEYCYRAGTTTEYWLGPTLVCGQAHFSYSYHTNTYCGGQFGQSSTANVGSYAANPWGLHDVAGNVEEWCLDSWDGLSNYSSAPVSDPFVTSGMARVVRGGSEGASSETCRAAFRSSVGPGFSTGTIGFRVVLAPVLVP